MMEIVFLSSSDIHGYILPTDYQNFGTEDASFGLSRVSSVIKSERAKYGANNVIVADTGDCLQGSPLAAYVHTADETALKQYTDLYNAVGYDVRCLGNHDFNFGLTYLSQYINYNHSTLLNANILAKKTAQPAFGQGYCIITKNGIKIGIIGVTTKRVPAWEPAENVTGLKFLSAFDQVRYYTQIIRAEVDILAVIYHGGFEADIHTGQATEPKTGENEGYRILKEIPEIDVFLTGHQHQKMSLEAFDTAIVQPGYRGEAVGKVVVEIDEDTKKIQSTTASLIDTKDYCPDKEIISLCSGLNKQTENWLDQPIAYLNAPAKIDNAQKARLQGAPFVNLLQQMQLYYTQADISATAVMSETAKGFEQKVTIRDILLNYPYANQLCRVKLTGKELRQIIEHSLSFLIKNDQGKIEFAPKYQNLLFNFDTFYPINYQAEIDRPIGQRLTKLELDGQEIADGQIYRLAVNNYRAMGGGFYPVYNLDKIEEIYDKDYVQMFQEFLTQIKPKVDLVKNYSFK